MAAMYRVLGMTGLTEVVERITQYFHFFEMARPLSHACIAASVTLRQAINEHFHNTIIWYWYDLECTLMELDENANNCVYDIYWDEDGAHVEP